MGILSPQINGTLAHSLIFVVFDLQSRRASLTVRIGASYRGLQIRRPSQVTTPRTSFGAYSPFHRLGRGERALVPNREGAAGSWDRTRDLSLPSRDFFPLDQLVLARIEPTTCHFQVVCSSHCTIGRVLRHPEPISI